VSYTLIGRNGKSFPSASPGKFGGHRRTKIYGRLDCRSALRAIDRGGYVTHRVFFATAAVAVAAGFRPCAVCLPAVYQTWKVRKLKSRRAG
jgi:methylphosphotriester-DNA--protein-cysteine methyltransferase